jgi:hypothetical protein
VSSNTKSFVNDLARSIRCCPFCSAAAHVSFEGISPMRFGVRCRSCGASVPVRHASQDDAVRAWNQRRGLATVGGKATRGIRSRRKLAAARRNLKTARKWKLIRQRVEAAYTALKPYRQKQLAEMEAAVAADRAWLKEKEPLILADPLLAKFYREFILKEKPAPGGTEANSSNPPIV